jgi:hypothetical protein
VAPEGEAFVRRFSLCCAREGCRARLTPPSLRFLGRRVYLGVVVLVASLMARRVDTLTEASRKTEVPVRTIRRWLRWWEGPFLSTEVFLMLQARLVGVDRSTLPLSIVRRLPGSLREQLRTMLEKLRPLTWGTLPTEASFLGCNV